MSETSANTLALLVIFLRGGCGPKAVAAAAHEDVAGAGLEDERRTASKQNTHSARTSKRIDFNPFVCLRFVSDDRFKFENVFLRNLG